MLSVLVVADDLTGANATGAMFRRLGLHTRTVRGPDALADLVQPDLDVLVLSTNSRQLTAHEAAETVTSALEAVGRHAGPRVLVKRVDTTLRGPLAAELLALLNHRRSVKDAVVALAVPAYPTAGRTTVGGIHLVDGQPLQRTAAARDPLTPVVSSRVSTLLTAGTPLRAEEIHLDDLAAEDFEARLSDALDRADVVVADSATDGDLAHVARAAARFRRSHPDTDVVVVDSGPFGALYCDALGLEKTRSDSLPIALVIGSMAIHTENQLITAQQALDFALTEHPLTRDPESVATVLRAIDAGDSVVGWRAPSCEQRLDRGLAKELPRMLADSARRVLSQRRLGGLFVCGGEVGAAVLDALSAGGLDVEGEVQPLVVAGRLAGGDWEGLPIITKGGLIGDQRAILDSILRLRSMGWLPHRQTPFGKRR